MVWVREINVRGPQGPSGGIDPNDPEMAASVAAAVQDRLNVENILRAYPEGEVGQTTLAAVPMHWTYKTLSQPYPATYPASYPGQWTGTTRRQGEVPILSRSGKLAAAQIPDAYWTAAEVQQAVADAIADLPAPEVPDTGEFDLPVFRARLVQARLTDLPLSVVFAGSSTTANNGVNNAQGYVAQVVSALQTLHPADGTESTVQVSPSADFTEVTTSGVHGYNAGQGGTNSADYLDDPETTRIAALSPALIVHMIGSNDWRQSRSPSAYGASLRARLEKFDTMLSAPCQHLLVQPYQRLDVSGSAWAWDEYADEQAQIAESRLDTAFLDISPTYVANGIPGDDPLSIIRSDNVHQSVLGYALMADAINSSVLRALHHV